MKTKLTSVTYLGYTAMDRRFSTPMLPWLLKEIRRTGVMEKLSIVIEDGHLKAFNGNFEPVIVHRLVDIIRASQVPGTPEELFYILYNEVENLLHFYLFRASSIHEVTDLFAQMRETSPGAPSPRGSTGSLNGSVMKNLSFQTSESSEHLPWSTPSISLPRNCNSNLSDNQQPLIRTTSNASALTSLCADLSPSDSHFFEVLYIGKVRISQRKVPDSLIDDALVKFSLHEADKARNHQARRHSLLSSNGNFAQNQQNTGSIENVSDFRQKTADVSNPKEQNVSLTNTSTTPLVAEKKFFNSTENIENTENLEDEFDEFSKERVIKKPTTPIEPKVTINKNLHTVAEDEEKNDDVRSVTSSITRSINEEGNEDFLGTEKTKEDSPMPMNFDEITRKPKLLRSKTGLTDVGKPFLRDRSASIGTLNLKTPIAHLIGEQNRTMLFQVGRSELRLISPDRKQILLHRAFKDVASCVLGRSNKEHFGFVCRENANDAYACYVFKCESDCVALEVVNAIKQAFVAHSELMKKSREKSPNMTCEHCPMLWYHRLCHDIEGMNEKKTHAFILRRIEQLPDDEQDQIITKYQGGTNHMYEVSEHNAFLMMLLRAHSEAKQMRHVHDTAENRSEFLNQYLGGSTIFMKAKRSLSSGFDHLLKRKASRDDIHIPVHLKKEASPLPSPVVDSASEPAIGNLLPPEDGRSKSLSPGVNNGGTLEPPPSPTSVSPNPGQEDEEQKTDPSNSPMMDIFLKVSDARPSTKNDSTEHEATWRQAIYQKVLQPSDAKEANISTQTLLNLPTATAPGKRTKQELRILWKMAIEQTVLLVRMERENARLREREESSAVRRIKLEYNELGICDAGVTLMWDSLLSTRDSGNHVSKVDHHMLTQAVIQGVPRMCRGGVWYFLAEQNCLRSPPPDTKKYPLYNSPYRTLLSGLTKHQHAILIDLGRTFPQHSYFASALGPGQLSLYNILKAYSLLDPDVGYCQGLSFVAGILLLHMDEAEAFVLLRHLMFRRGLRRQYLPDMSALQVQLYQLSRLLRDHEPELHEKLESLDISPALYAAPWMLTLFTSQFPIGFVVRVFDLVFLESLDIVFAVSLALLSVHKDGLMLCESCEEAAEYLKHKLPQMDKTLYEKVMRKVLTLDLNRQLSEYAVEYAVLREEMPRVTTLTEENRKLSADNRRMSDELDSAMDAITNYQNSQGKLESQVKIMEQQLSLLSRFITVYHKQELPNEVKKIVQSHTKKPTFGAKIFSKHNDDDDENRKVFKTGVSAPNLFAKITKEDVLNAMNKEKKSSPEHEKRLLKKSQSVHSGLMANSKIISLKVLDENEENLFENIKELGRKGLNTEDQIKQERMFEQKLKHDFDQNLKKEVKNTSYMDDLSIFQSRKSMSLNLVRKDGDSGFVTPLSPDKKDVNNDNVSIISHPLSDCDVDIKFDGQSTKLKQIRPIVKSFDGFGAKN